MQLIDFNEFHLNLRLLVRHILWRDAQNSVHLYFGLQNLWDRGYQKGGFLKNIGGK